MVFMCSDKCPCTTNEITEEVKEEFYNLLEKNVNQIARSDIKVILEDFNAKKAYTNPPLAI